MADIFRLVSLKNLQIEMQTLDELYLTILIADDRTLAFPLGVLSSGRILRRLD